MCKRKSAVRILMVLALFPVTIMLALIFYSYSSIQDERSRASHEVQQIDARKWDMIENIIEENEQKARIQADGVKVKIMSDLLTVYDGRMNILHDDLAAKSNSPAFKILNNDISGIYLNKDSENNRIFVANKTGILADRGYVSSTKRSRDWDAEIKSKLNSELASKAVSMILTKNKEMIYWKHDLIQNDNNSGTESDPSMEALKRAYANFGLDGLKNYNILVPVYITNDGDIFDIPDVDLHGKGNNNDKIIVIQEFSIYDAVQNHKDDLERYDTYSKDVERTMELAIQAKMESFGLLMILNFVSLIAMLYGANVFIKWGGDDDTSDGSNNS